MKKIIMLILLSIILTGCTVVRIDTKSIDNILYVILSKNNTLFNRIGKGYKYYIPRGVTYIDTIELNDKLYSNGNYYYLYIDAIHYYYNSEIKYEKDPNAYYSKAIDLNDKKGYLEIVPKDNKYLIEFVYNYAVINALVEKEDINDVVLNATYLLSTIKFNNNVIKLMLNDDYFIYKEEKYKAFEPKKETNNFLRFADDVEETNESE